MKGEVPVIIIKNNAIQEVKVKDAISKYEKVKICEGKEKNSIGILDGYFVVLKSKNHKSPIPDLSPLWLFEFKEYKFEGQDGWELEELGEAEIVDKKVKEGNKYEKVKEFNLTKSAPFQNYTGKSVLRLKNKENGKIIEIPIEVVSEKLIPEKNGKINTDSPLFYPEFAINLINDIWELMTVLPFNIETPVYISTSLVSRKTHPLFTYLFLKNNSEELKSSLNVIRSNPYRILKKERDFIDVSEISEVDAETVYSIVTNPEYLYKTENTGFKVNNEYYAPLKVYAPLKYETLDNPENRFVLYFVKLLVKDIEKIKEIREIEKISPEILELEGFMEDFINDPLWEGVGELVVFPSTSTVLRMRDGYRELFMLYLKYLFARKPFEEVEEAINLRKVYELYEFWCALKLYEVLNKERNKINVKTEDKIPETLKMSFKFLHQNKVYEFIYQHLREGYSGLRLKPDFSIYEGKKAVLLLDAKFAFDIKSIKSNEDEMKNAEQENRFPKTGNIVKMHAYKDALKVKACIVLYPGNESKFYKEEREVLDFENKNEEVLFEILEKGYKGIGWIPFLPYKKSKTTKMTPCKNIIKILVSNP